MNEMAVSTYSEMMFAISEYANEKAYEQYNAGEISQNELLDTYTLITRWEKDSETLLKMCS